MLLGRVMHAVGAAGAVGGAMMLASKVTECSVDGNVPVHIGKWIDGWSKGRTSFHKNDVNPTLQKYGLRSLCLTPQPHVRLVKVFRC